MATLAPFGAGVPVVVSLHNPIRGSGSSPRRVVGEAAARGVVRRAALVTGASSDLVADARALGARRAELAEVPSPRVPTLLATDRAGWRAAHRDALLARHDLAGETPFVLTIARVAPQKGIDVLAEAARGLADAVHRRGIRAVLRRALGAGRGERPRPGRRRRR